MSPSMILAPPWRRFQARLPKNFEKNSHHIIDFYFCIAENFRLIKIQSEAITRWRGTKVSRHSAAPLQVNDPKSGDPS